MVLLCKCPLFSRELDSEVNRLPKLFGPDGTNPTQACFWLNVCVCVKKKIAFCMTTPATPFPVAPCLSRKSTFLASILCFIPLSSTHIKMKPELERPASWTLKITVLESFERWRYYVDIYTKSRRLGGFCRCISWHYVSSQRGEIRFLRTMYYVRTAANRAH